MDSMRSLLSTSDFLQVREHKLSNDLTVWLNEDHSQPKIFGAVVVKAGAKDSPNTGIAHYFEHMMCKGTDKIGTIDYESEKVLLDIIAEKYDALADTEDPKMRAHLQQIINDLSDMANTETDADVLNSIDSASNNPIPVIYQSGYLTIKDYEPEFKIYRLGFPNQEAEEGFMKYLLPFYTNIQASKSPFEIGRFVREVRAGDYDAFFHRLQSFFADTSYEAIIGRNPERDTELHYRNVLFIVFKLVGLYTQVEYHTSNGRIDLVLQTDRYVYIMEFKLNGTAEEALRQIEEKGYALPFAGDDREVLKIGANFSSETRNIERWLVG